MANILYGLAGQNLATQYTPSSTGLTADPVYPISNISDVNPATYMSCTNAAGGRLVWNMSSAKTVGFFAFFNHNFPVTASQVRIMANSSDSWTSPPYSKYAVVPAPWGDGMKGNFYVDTSDASAYQYWAVSFTSAINPVKLGELWIAQVKNEFPVNVDWGVEYALLRKHITHETDYGIKLIYDMGSTIRKFKAKLVTTDAGYDAYEVWWRDARGPTRPVVVILDSSGDVWMVRFAGDELVDTWQFLDTHEIEVEFDEVPSGLQV